MNAQPQLVLTLMYWLHMIGTVVWIGSLASLTLLVLPAARRTLNSTDADNLIAQIQVRLQATGWFSLAVLTGTGLFQMSASPSYQGFLAIANPWAVAILLKHLAFGLMILLSAYLTWGLGPAKRRALLRQSGGLDAADLLARLRLRERWITVLNLVIAAVILAFTALARTS